MCIADDIKLAECLDRFTLQLFVSEMINDSVMLARKLSTNLVYVYAWAEQAHCTESARITGNSLGTTSIQCKVT